MKCKNCNVELDEARAKDKGRYCSWRCKQTKYRESKKAKEPKQCQWCPAIIEDKRRYKYCCRECSRYAHAEIRRVSRLAIWQTYQQEAKQLV